MERTIDLHQEIGRRVGFGPRLGAVALDSLLIAIASYFTAVAALPFLKELYIAFADARIPEGPDKPYLMETARQLISETGAPEFTLIASGFLAPVYYLAEVFFSASPAKFLIGLKIVRLREAGTQKKGSYLLRYGLKMISNLFFVLGYRFGVPWMFFAAIGLGLIVLFGALTVFGPRRQTVWDMLSRTTVYRTEDIGKPVPEALV